MRQFADPCDHSSRRKMNATRRTASLVRSSAADEKGKRMERVRKEVRIDRRCTEIYFVSFSSFHILLRFEQIFFISLRRRRPRWTPAWRTGTPSPRAATPPSSSTARWCPGWLFSGVASLTSVSWISRNERYW